MYQKLNGIYLAGRAGAATQDVSRTATAIAVLVLLITLQCLLALVRLALYCFGVNPGAFCNSLPVVI